MFKQPLTNYFLFKKLTDKPVFGRSYVTSYCFLLYMIADLHVGSMYTSNLNEIKGRYSVVTQNKEVQRDERNRTAVYAYVTAFS